MTVEVVGRDVEQHRDLGGEGGAVLELEGGALADDRRVLVDLAPVAPRAGGRRCRRRRPACPASRQTWPSHSTTVVLPFVPVTATNGFGSERQASSSSPITGTPRSRATSITGAVCGTPGLLITRPIPSEVLRAVVIQVNFDARLPQSCIHGRRSRIDGDDPRPRLREQPRRRLARAGHADDQVGPRAESAGLVSITRMFANSARAPAAAPVRPRRPHGPRRPAGGGLRRAAGAAGEGRGSARAVREVGRWESPAPDGARDTRCGRRTSRTSTAGRRSRRFYRLDA